MEEGRNDSCFAVVVQPLSLSDSATPWMQHARLPCPSPSPRVCSNSCPLSQWCHPTISSSVVPFSSSLLSFPGLGSLPMNQVSSSEGRSIGASASASVLPMDIQVWFPLGCTGLISLQSKGLSCSPRVFSNTTVQKHQPLTSIYDHWKNHTFHYMDLCWQSNVSAFQYAV